MTHFHNSTNTLWVLSLVEEMSQFAAQIESNQSVSDEDVEMRLTQMKEIGDAVLGLASQHPQLPAQFTRARQQLREYIRNRRGAETVDRSQVAKFRFQGLIDLAKSEDKLRSQQDHLESEAWAILIRGETATAAQKLEQSLALLDRRRTLIGDEKQQIFFAKEGKHIISRFLNEYLRRQYWSPALELIERTKSRAFLNQLGLVQIRKPTTNFSELTEREEALLVQVRQISSAARSNARIGDGVRGFELWDRAVTLLLELDDVWATLAKDSTWAEYVSLRRGSTPNLQQIRDCLL